MKKRCIAALLLSALIFLCACGGRLASSSPSASISEAEIVAATAIPSPKSSAYSSELTMRGNADSLFAQGQTKEEESDFSVAAECYHRAMFSGHMPAQSAYLRLCRAGYAENPPDEADQRTMLLECAGQLDAWALGELSRFYAEGIGGNVDQDLAQITAAMSGQKDALQRLEAQYAARPINDGEEKSLADAGAILPRGLVEELLPVVYAGSIYSWMDSRAVESTPFENLFFAESEDLCQTATEQYYAADFNGDGQAECLQISSQGSRGYTDFLFFTANEKGALSSKEPSQGTGYGTAWVLEEDGAYYLAFQHHDISNGSPEALEIYPLADLSLGEGISLSIRVSDSASWRELVTKPGGLPASIEADYRSATGQLLAQEPNSGQRGIFILPESWENWQTVNPSVRQHLMEIASPYIDFDEEGNLIAVDLDGDGNVEYLHRDYFLTTVAHMTNHLSLDIYAECDGVLEPAEGVFFPPLSRAAEGPALFLFLQSFYVLESDEGGAPYILAAMNPPHFSGMAYLAVYHWEDGSARLLRSSLFLPESMDAVSVLVENISFSPWY